MKNTPANNPKKQSRASKEERSSRAPTGSANVSGAPQHDGAGGGRAELDPDGKPYTHDPVKTALAKVDELAREGARYCWQNATSTEAVKVGDRFWTIHCELLPLMGREGQGEQSSDSEPRHSPSAQAQRQAGENL